MIKIFPEYQFVVLAIVANRSLRGKFVYDLPENVVEVHELYLEDADWRPKELKRAARLKLNEREYAALRSLLMNQNVDWDTLFSFFGEKEFSLNELLMGEDFFRAVQECYTVRYAGAVFSDFLWTMRSMYLPLFLTLGIYTREREEELIRADWVSGIYKNIWIEQFKKMSKLAYDRADLVTSLYAHARELQIELGCPADKTSITPNGIDPARFTGLKRPEAMEPDMVHIGAVLRVTPIKDVKTMIRAFAYAKRDVPNLKLWIMGPTEEDEEYARECFDLVELMELPDVVFTGRVNVTEYLGGLDFTILTSISEGQPLTVLEGYAAKLPAIATDVGNCRGLLYGEDDDFGEAGILTHIMNVKEIADAMVNLARHPVRRKQMGENGYRRVMAKYKISDMQQTYRKIYETFENIDW